MSSVMAGLLSSPGLAGHCGSVLLSQGQQSCCCRGSVPRHGNQGGKTEQRIFLHFFLSFFFLFPLFFFHS